MRVSALLLTHHLQEEVLPWMAAAQSIFDELVIFVDEKRATAGTLSFARKLSRKVYLYSSETWYGDYAAMVRSCAGKWVFSIDYDEELSPEWQRSDWRRVVETTECTHFWVPRRWIVSPGQYLTSNPWCPDFQLRFFRNNLDGTLFPKKLHDRAVVPGPGACLRNLALNHHVLWLSSRAMREEKVRLYEHLMPGGSEGQYYLYEDYSPRHARIPAPVVLDPGREILPMVRLSPEQTKKVSLQVGSVPAAVTASKFFWVDVEIKNETAETLHSRPPHLPVHLSYHWIEKMTRQVCIWEGRRNGIFPDVQPKTTTPCTMMVIAPDRPGQYILQISLVQENVCWFENINPAFVQELVISVTPKQKCRL